jgi:hypothetical protein
VASISGSLASRADEYSETVDARVQQMLAQSSGSAQAQTTKFEEMMARLKKTAAAHKSGLAGEQQQQQQQQQQGHTQGDGKETNRESQDPATSTGTIGAAGSKEESEVGAHDSSPKESAKTTIEYDSKSETPGVCDGSKFADSK